MLFAARFIDREGIEQSELIAAENFTSAESAVRQRADLILRLRRANTIDRARSAFSGWIGSKTLGTDKLKDFAHILGSYLRAGISIQEALRLSAITEPAIQPFADAVRQRLATGHAIDEALRLSGFAVPQGFIALVRAGAESGTLQEVLASEAQRLGSVQEIRRDLAASLIYPIALIVMCVLVVAYMLIAIVPQLRASISEEAMGRLSWWSRSIFAASDRLTQMSTQALAGWVLLLIAGVVLSVVATRDFRRRAVIHTPIIGKIVTSLSMASFCSALSTMLGASVKTESAWRLASAAVTQPFIRTQLEQAGARIVQGLPISQAARETGVMADDVVALFALGERTGTLPALLNEAGRFHASEALTRIRKLAGMAAPAVILLAGLLVGSFAVAMMTTILSVNQIYGG